MTVTRFLWNIYPKCVANPLLLLFSCSLFSCHHLPTPKTPTTMFTAEQIKEAHAKVKSGADYPRYVQNLKNLGVAHYDYMVENGQNVYYATDGTPVKTVPAQTSSRVVSSSSSPEELKRILLIHQQRQTDYPTFCQQAAEVGVERWTSDLEKMVCSYYDKKGTELYAEPIPSIR